jgi:hypothetical protein
MKQPWAAVSHGHVSSPKMYSATFTLAEVVQLHCIRPAVKVRVSAVRKDGSRGALEVILPHRVVHESQKLRP